MFSRSRNAQPKSSITTSKWKLALIAISAAFVLTAIIYAGFVKWSAHGINHSKGYAYIGTNGTVKVYACKTYFDGYGGVFQITAMLEKPTTAPNVQYYATSIRKNAPVPDQPVQGNSYANGTTAAVKTNASSYSHDKFVIILNGTWPGTGAGSWSSGVRDPSWLPNCS